ncbi:hypothetical protein [Rahnella sp. Larv3_ips]|uniref:hypothetical protein n=1 Tax=Rahnella sp. Larv3_ips TaxID=1896943 RepID=UPI000EFC8B8E|nr:hypothetical protein [Rahnella sp. Larv3_ips]
MKTYPELVLEELQRDATPRTSAQLEAEITARTGVKAHKTAVHGAIIALRARPEVHLVHTETYPRKYSLATPSGSVKTKAEISAEFERNLWAVRQGRGQA